MLTTWELAQGMCNKEYVEGDVFYSEAGDVFISKDGKLLWEDTKNPVEIVIGDNLMWRKENKENKEN